MIVATSSGIGGALARRWLARGWSVTGTWRSASPTVDALRAAGAQLVRCDLARAESVDQAALELRERAGPWDVLVLASGQLDPIGLFPELDIDSWERSLRVNLIGPLRLLRALLPARRLEGSPAVLCFAGGGTNGPVPRFSAYTLSKIALIKMTELLAAEVPDTRFSIVGPGWVDTPIHQQTLAAGARAGSALSATRDHLARSDFTPMEDVVACCEWVLDRPASEVSGRNFSVVWDRWGSPELARLLSEDPELGKLRRHGNEVLGAIRPA